VTDRRPAVEVIRAYSPDTARAAEALLALLDRPARPSGATENGADSALAGESAPEGRPGDVPAGPWAKS
jgi:hypothetical protein